MANERKWEDADEEFVLRVGEQIVLVWLCEACHRAVARTVVEDQALCARCAAAIAERRARS